MVLEDLVPGPEVRVQLAGFLLGNFFPETLDLPNRLTRRVDFLMFPTDDGSSLCSCWADSDRARTMLRLEESSCESFFRDQDNACHRLKKMVQKHRRIIVSNFGARVDFVFSLTGAAFSLDSGEDLSGFDLEVLKSVILHALNGPNLVSISSSLFNLDPDF